MTGTIRGSSKETIYQQLGFESFRFVVGTKNFAFFYKVLNDEHPQYLFNFIPVGRTVYSTRNALNFPFLDTNHNIFLKNVFFFPSTIIWWNKLYRGLRKAECSSFFKTNMLKLSSYGHFQTLSAIAIILKE